MRSHRNFRFAVTDPSYATPRTAVLPLRRDQGPNDECACHEGNYGMFGLLSGHRAEEREAAKHAKGGWKALRGTP